MANRNQLPRDRRDADRFELGAIPDSPALSPYEPTGDMARDVFCYQQLQIVANVYGCSVDELRSALPVTITTKEAMYLLTEGAVKELGRLAKDVPLKSRTLQDLLLRLVKEDGAELKRIGSAVCIDYESVPEDYLPGYSRPEDLAHLFAQTGDDNLLHAIYRDGAPYPIFSSHGPDYDLVARMVEGQTMGAIDQLSRFNPSST